MESQDLTDQLSESIEAADLELLTEDAQSSSDADSFADIVADIMEGETTVDDVDRRIVAWLNRTFDIPFVPEAIEGKLFGLAVDAVKAAAVQTAKRLA